MTYIWFLQNEPEVYKTAYRVGHLPTYIHKQLTGEWMVDLVNASMMGLYETTTQRGWSDELIHAFGLERSLLVRSIIPERVTVLCCPKSPQNLA